MQADCGTWEEEAVQELDLLTLCATWKVVMVRRRGWRGDTPTIQVVDTTTDQVLTLYGTGLTLPLQTHSCH